MEGRDAALALFNRRRLYAIAHTGGVFARIVGTMGKLYSYTYMSLDGVMANPETWFSPYSSDELGDDLTRRLEYGENQVSGLAITPSKDM